MTERKPFLRTLALALACGLLFWLVDSLAYRYYFSQNLHRMIFEPPETLFEAFLLKAPAHTLFVRLSFLLACVLGAWRTHLGRKPSWAGERVHSELPGRIRVKRRATS